MSPSWRPARRRFAALALVTATLTATAGAVLGGAGAHMSLSFLYVALVAVALLYPAAIAAQVVGGQVLVGTILAGAVRPPLLLSLAMLAGIVATAELLAVVARLDTPIEADPTDELPRIGLASLAGAAIFAAVLLASGLPGPGGLVAVALASAACLVLAGMLAGHQASRTK